MAQGNSHSLQLSVKTRTLLLLLILGVVGMASLLSANYLFPPPESTESTYASHGLWHNLRDIFLIPGVLFFGVLMVYSITELYKSYRALNDPDTYRQKRADKAAGKNGRRRRQTPIAP